MSHFIVHRGRYRLEAQVCTVGPDLVVCLGGGDRHHVGAVTVAEPRPSQADPTRLSATSSVWNRLGHKDEALVRPMAEHLAARCGRLAVVVGGAHVDNLPPEGVQAFVQMAAELTEQIESYVRQLAETHHA
ncbi:MAG: hypothetical protein GX605_07235 [Chloroflexi bacterium]|nr:hypothetical protein [Chloroflexota bacterium]